MCGKIEGMGGVDGGNAGRATDSGGNTLQDLIPRLHELLTLDWATATDSDAVEAAAVLEALARQVQAAQVRAAGELETRLRAGRYAIDGVGSPNPSMFLRQHLLISAREAASRLGLARATQERIDPFGVAVHPAPAPLVATVLNAGRVSSETARILIQHVQAAQNLEDGHRVSAGTTVEVEEALVAIGVEEDPDYLARCGTRTINALDPDGDEPTEGELIAKESITFTRPRRGMIGFRGHLRLLDYEELMTAIGTATNPRTSNSRKAPDSGAGAGSGTPGDGCEDPSAHTLFTDQGLFGDQGPAPEWATGIEAPNVFSGAGFGQPTTDTDADGDPDAAAAPDEDRDVDDDAPVLDRRTRAQKLLHALVDCARIAVRTR
nr:DUF222 domain-containing protein [Acidobacteriota bacterium]